MWEHAPAERTKTKFGKRGCMADVIICGNFVEIGRGISGLREAKNGGLPLTLTVTLTTCQHYRAACDSYKTPCLPRLVHV